LEWRLFLLLTGPKDSQFPLKPWLCRTINPLMQTIEILFTVETEARDLPAPKAATEDSAGADLRAALTEPVVIEPGKFRLVSTGLRMHIPRGYEGQVRPRSGLAARHGITCLNTPGTIDADYRGIVQVLLINHGAEPFIINHGDRIAQLIVAPVTRGIFTLAETLDETSRGDGGFGHTGLQ
jgi:dUTP pyrophosphatase